MVQGRVYLFVCSLVALALLLAACGQESDLHTLGKSAPTITPVGKPLPTVPPMLAPGQPAPGQRVLSGAVPTLPPPLATTTRCGVLSWAQANSDRISLPQSVPTIDPLRITPATPVPGALDGPATLTIPVTCNQRVVEMHVGETLDIVLDGQGAWSAASNPPGVLRSLGLLTTANGGRWRYQAAKPGPASVSIYETPSCARPPCTKFHQYINLGVLVH